MQINSSYIRVLATIIISTLTKGSVSYLLTSPTIPLRARQQSSLQLQLRAHVKSSSSVTTMTTSFAEYLSQTTESFRSNFSKKYIEPTYHIILGNEAGDCDSIVSALALAYTQSLVDKDKVSDGSKIYLPVCSIEKGDMALRRETVLLLKKCGVDPESLLYLDDMSVCHLLSEDSANAQQLELTLTDHNTIRSSLKHLSSNAKQIIDHHADEGSHQHVTGEAREIAFCSESNKALVGSACTLVAEHLVKATSYFEKGFKIDAGAATALLGTIVIDTMNMSESAGKGTKRDADMIDALMNSTGWNEDCEPPNLEELYKWLNNAKFDATFWDEMSARDCLRIDYKRFQPSNNSNAFGISSVLLPIEKLFAKSEFIESAKSFMEDGHVELLGVMSMVIEGGTPRREMLLIGEKCKVESMTDFLTTDDDASFLEISVSAVDDSNISSDLATRIFSQGNIKGSRKQVAPVMMKCKL